DGNAYLVGMTFSPDLSTLDAFQPILGGSASLPPGDGPRSDAFITALNPSGSALIYSTFLGGNHTEFPTALALDAEGTVTIAGYTGSPDFPRTPGAIMPTTAATSNGFVSKISQNTPKGNQVIARP